LYEAWTTGWGLWFAEPESLRVQDVVGAPFFFEVVQRADDGTPKRRHAHYGRFLSLVPYHTVSFTWLTLGTRGVETTVILRLEPSARGTKVTLTHAGFSSAEARDGHAAAWPYVLEQQEARLLSLGAGELPARAPMIINRSIPDATFIPVRSYPDLDSAVEWLRDVLGCRERLRIPGHRVQLTLGNGAVVAAAWDPGANPATGGRPPASLMVRVQDIDATYARALASGATGLSAPTDFQYGERQAQVRDPAGHAWTLTQTTADVDPASWGGELLT
jgi:uncharacterized glyoxalase superfamily protein PhnB/uncharacterized protein YndB with AHSA1/START domain